MKNNLNIKVSRKIEQAIMDFEAMELSEKEEFLFKTFNEKYGNVLDKRFKKLDEELGELYKELYPTDNMEELDLSIVDHHKVVDEIGDVLMCLLHICNLYDHTLEDIIQMTYRKIKIREEIPEYKH